MDKSTLSRNVARMRRRGWLATDADDDRRTHTLRLTATGTRLLREAFPLWQKAQDEAARRMGGAGVAALATLVKRLRALDAAAPESVASLPRRARRSG
jgi:DNA-binding MarR family transcriptional regulator